jgi:hypothetical protein
MRRLHFALLSLVLVLAAQPLVAATYYVGTCKSGAYANISGAVALVPAGSTIDVCPGTYNEQVTISKPLTLRGISYGNSSQAIIAMAPSGLTTTSSLAFGTVAAQVEVTAGPVNITGITVDGTSPSANCPSPGVAYVGVFYSSGSSGTVNQVETQYQSCNLGGVGILAENGAGPSKSVTIENSYIHDSSYGGIWAYSNQNPPSLTASINGNSVASVAPPTINGTFVYNNGPVVGIEVHGTDGGVSNNSISQTDSGLIISSSIPVSGNTVIGTGVADFGIEVWADAVVSGNTVANAWNGMYVGNSGASVKSNHILLATPIVSGMAPNGPYGILLGANDVTVENNVITGSVESNIFTGANLPLGALGIEFDCFTDTVSGNMINGVLWGIDAPAAYTGVNTFSNVPTVRQPGGSC